MHTLIIGKTNKKLFKKPIYTHRPMHCRGQNLRPALKWRNKMAANYWPYIYNSKLTGSGTVGTGLTGKPWTYIYICTCSSLDKRRVLPLAQSCSHMGLHNSLQRHYTAVSLVLGCSVHLRVSVCAWVCVHVHVHSCCMPINLDNMYL